jgi:hypothetical protein
MASEPMIKLEPGGKAPVLSYDVPDPTSYSGSNFTEIDVPEDWFKPALKQPPSDDERTRIRALTDTGEPFINAVALAMKQGFADRRMFPNAAAASGVLRMKESPNPGTRIDGSLPVTSRLATLQPEEVAAQLRDGHRLNIFRSLSGSLTYNYVPEPKAARPRLYLVETFQLSSFLGAYGAGRTLKTYSLFPGEKTTISVKTYAKTESEAKQASSILDSITDESAQEFQSSLQSEQANKAAYSESFEYHAEAEASGSFGVGSAKVSGGIKGGSQSSREESAKNVASATEKHAARASAKRDVQVNTSFEVKEEQGEETATQREIQNINLSRTLNIVFRQMNQEFISILHLVDVRVGFFNGYGESTREAALPELDDLLEEVMVDDGKKRAQVRDWLLGEIETIFDYQGNLHSLVEEVKRTDAGGQALAPYNRVRSEIVSTYEDPTTGTERDVSGIILKVQKCVLRTDGVIAEALLGQGEALDEYATELQEVEVDRRRAEGRRLAAEAERAELINQLAGDGDADKAKILAELTCPCGAPEPAAPKPA